MTVESEGLLGRERELAAVARFLASTDEHPAAVVLEGEPGIGKTALFARATDEAERHGYRILAATPTRAESPLSFVALTDLLADAHELFAELPVPQRRALEQALLLDEPGDTPPDPRAIGMGLLGVLRTLAASSPVVVAVDDAQWLDQASAAALSFAFRRLRYEQVGLLATLRKGEGSAAPKLGAELQGERVGLGPLSAGAVRAVLSDRLQLSIPRTLLLRIHESCRGNPLFALELGRALQEQGLPEPGQPFELPPGAEALFAARLERLPEDTLDALAVAAASAAPTRALVSAVSAGALQPAVAAEVVRLDGERIHFTHPLLASASYRRLDMTSRRELHRRIAAAVTDREERARHLALAAHGPDAHVAAALDKAAEQASRRGAPAAAAELTELAVKLTPSGDTDASRIRRRVAAQYAFLAGDFVRSRWILEQLVGELPPGIERARVLHHLADTHGEGARALSLREQAVAEAVGDDYLLAAALRKLAYALFVTGNPVPALARAREAVAAAERVGDVRLLAPSLAYVAAMEAAQGRIEPGLLERALSLEQQAGYLRAYDSPTMIDGFRLAWLADDLDGARTQLAAVERRAREHGDDQARANTLYHLAALECRAGRFDDAARYAGELDELDEQFFPGGIASANAQMALANALRGRVEAAEAEAERARANAERGSHEIAAVTNSWVLGFIALSHGDGSAAERILAPLPERIAAHGWGRVMFLDVIADTIEATISVGELDRAAGQLERLAEIAGLGIAYAQARAARCHGLLTAAKRDYEAAFESFAEALSAHERLPDPLERGRTLLALGQTQRRAGRRRDARETLEQALAIFDELRAALWAEQAQAELSRLGGRTASEQVLTGAEKRVARLVAEGRTNSEVAAALFVTKRTVETHLTSIYRKLDLRSRTELAGRLAGENDRKTQ